MLPDFVIYETPEEYKCYYEEIYCKAPTLTFDGIKVFFSKTIDFINSIKLHYN